MLKFNLLILPEERMNFKLSNIPGNNVYIKIGKINDDILAQIVSDLISDTAKFSLQFDETMNGFQSNPACCIHAIWERIREKRRFFYFVSPL